VLRSLDDKVLMPFAFIDKVIKAKGTNSLALNRACPKNGIFKKPAKRGLTHSILSTTSGNKWTHRVV
jgi:hypothetical protein